jgi:hypothetical protein
MELTLLTYDCTVAHNAGYLQTGRIVDFVEQMSDLAQRFSNETGIPVENVFWNEVTHSDWCKNCVMVWGRVENDWEPTPNTKVWDERYFKTWYPNLASSFYTFCVGGGKYVNIVEMPPQTPHKRFKSVEEN